MTDFETPTVHGIATKRVRAVVFDLGGVFLEGTVEKVIEFGAKVGLSRDEWEVIREDLFIGKGPWDELERGETTLDNFADILKNHLARKGINLDIEKARNFMGSPGDALDMPIRQEIVRACLAVRKIMPTALLTNNIMEWRDSWRGRMDVEALFDEVVDSSEVGMRKPEDRIYKLMEEKLGKKGDEILFIDDLGINLKAARQLGWRTLKYDSTSKVLEVLEAVINGDSGS